MWSQKLTLSLRDRWAKKVGKYLMSQKITKVQLTVNMVPIFFIKKKKKKSAHLSCWKYYKQEVSTREPMVLNRSPECWVFFEMKVIIEDCTMDT